MEMTIETAVLNKLRQLPQAQQQEVLRFIEFLETKVDKKYERQGEALAAAAKALLSDYQTDDELTAKRFQTCEERSILRCGVGFAAGWASPFFCLY